MALPQPQPVRRLEPQNRVAGKYRLRRRIAVGGMGEIWVARNEATAADVALKVLRRETDERMQAEARFRHEARLSARLTHRSIIRIFDLVEEPDGTLILVMELLRGETLHQYLERKGPRPPREAVAIIAPILSALQHAHDHGIVHRDVTPSNIFLAVDPDGQVTPKLVDFGIAKVTADPPARERMADLPHAPIQTSDGRVLGTPRYMSPEQIRSQPDLDGRSDIFAVGVVLYEVLTGVSPFASSTPAASLAAVLEAPVDPDARIDPKLWVEIQRAMAKRPYERHASAAELAAALRAAVGETEGTLQSALQRTHPPPRWEDMEHRELPAHETKSIEGQSLVMALPRKRVSWLAWVAGGVVVGAIGAFTVGVLRDPSWVQPAPVRAAASATPAAGALPPAATTADTPAAQAVSTAAATAPSETATATAPPQRAVPARPVPAAPATTTPVIVTALPDPRAPAAPPQGGHAKPIATTPGF